MDKFAQHYVAHLKRAAGGLGSVVAGLATNPWTRKHIMGGILGGTVGGVYSLNNTQGQDLPNQAFNAALNTGVGFMAGTGRAGLVPSVTAFAALPMKDFALKGIDTLHHADRAIDAYSKDRGAIPTEGIVDYVKNHPGQVAAGAGATALGGAGLYALVQAARAAKRLGDGHAIRLSTSLRKRPGQSTDLNLGFSQMAPGRLGRGGRRTADSEDGPVDEGSQED